MRAAFFSFSKWYESEDGEFDLSILYDVAIRIPLVSHQDADIIFIDYGGNADYVPYLCSLVEQYPQKTFVFLVGENLRRRQAIIPKKITTKASTTTWARKVFPLAYPLANVLFTKPEIQGDIQLYKFLYDQRNNPRVFSFLCESPAELGKRSFFYPLLLRRIINYYIPEEYRRAAGYTESDRYRVFSDNMSSLHPQVIDEQGNNTREIFFSAVFGNTTRERVTGCKSIERYYPVNIYGKNPISNCGKLDGDVLRIYGKSRYVMSFENSFGDEYVSEKLLHSIHARSIPIFWGVQDVSRYCNPKTVIFCKDYADVRRLGDMVKDAESRIQSITEEPYFFKSHIDFYANTYENARRQIMKIVESLS